MQGLPTNLLTPNTAQGAGKVESSSLVGVNGKVVAEKGQEENSFASFFANLFGNNSEAPTLEKSAENSASLVETKKSPSPESKIDVLLKTKDQEQNKKTEVLSLTPEQALSPEVLKNIDNLLVKETSVNPTLEKKIDQSVVSDKIANTSTNLEQLLKTLKNDQPVDSILPDAEIAPEAKETTNSEKMSPLDFLLKESKANEVVLDPAVNSKKVTGQSDFVSKLGFSGEDFIEQLNSGADLKSEKIISKSESINPELINPRDLINKQMNHSMKAYGQKQNLLSDNIIKNTHDLAFKENKPIGKSDELKNPDLKIGAELSMIKEPLIPVMLKQEFNQTTDTQTASKVLDLSKINTSNTNEIIKRISDYVEQSQVAGKDSLDLTVKHDSLGQFKIQVNRPSGTGANQPMDMQIVTSTAEGHDFFVKNEIGLMKNLSQAGIQLSDLRIVSGGEAMNFSQSDSRQSSNNSQFGNQSQREFMSFDSGDSSQGSQRRRELWEEARNNQQRYGA